MVIIVIDVKLYYDVCDSTKILVSVGVHDACSLAEWNFWAGKCAMLDNC